MLLFIIKKIIKVIRIKRDPLAYARSIGVTLGEHCKLVDLTGGTFGQEPYLVSLGDHVELSYDVRCITHDGGVWVCRDEHPDLDVMGRISIGNNVFVGARAILLPGTTIGDNCVIGAGSIVKGSIPSNSVAAGMPARVLKATSDYIESCVENGVATKRLSPAIKKKKLLELFPVALSRGKLPEV